MAIRTATGSGILSGTSSADEMYGGTGGYTGVQMYGGDGADKLYAGNMTSSSAYGGSGADSLYGGGQSNSFYGGDEADTIYGGGTSNTFYGGAGNDVFYAGTASNGTFNGTSGADTFHGASASGANTFNSGGAGSKYYVEQATGNLTIKDAAASGTVYFEHALSTYTRTVDGGKFEISFSGNGQSVDTFNVETFAFSNGAGGYTTYTYADLACFLTGTLIRTPEGDVAVEALQPGDLVMTVSGLAKPVLWVGLRAVETRLAHPLTDTPIRIKAHALGFNLPERDLYVSPDHGFLIDGVLVQAGALVNGATIVRPRDLPETFTYFHVELEEHDFLYAEGLPAETYLDNGTREGFDNAAEFPGRSRPAEEMDMPRVKSRRQLPKMLARALDHLLLAGARSLKKAV